MGVFKTHGLVEHLLSDNGTCFMPADFRTVAYPKDCGVKGQTPHKPKLHVYYLGRRTLRVRVAVSSQNMTAFPPK